MKKLIRLQKLVLSAASVVALFGSGQAQACRQSVCTHRQVCEPAMHKPKCHDVVSCTPGSCGQAAELSSADFNLETLATPVAAPGPVPVTATKDQAALLKSQDPKLAANKKLAYDFFRVILRGRRLERAAEFLSVGYIQHNPNVNTGLSGFLDFFQQLGGPRDVPDELPGLVTIQAEGDFVTLSFVDEEKGADGRAYTTTWFDMFRIEGGKIAEHWDNDLKSK